MSKPRGENGWVSLGQLASPRERTGQDVAAGEWFVCGRGNMSISDCSSRVDFYPAGDGAVGQGLPEWLIGSESRNLYIPNAGK